MSNGRRTYVGRCEGLTVIVKHDQRGNQQICDPEHAHHWRWFLHIDDEYIGDFSTCTEACDEIFRRTGVRPPIPNTERQSA